MKKFLAGIAVIGALMVCSVDAMQVCATAMQVTFKSGVNLVVDLETGIELY